MLDTTPVYDSYNGITWLISKLLSGVQSIIRDYIYSKRHRSTVKVFYSIDNNINISRSFEKREKKKSKICKKSSVLNEVSSQQKAKALIYSQSKKSQKHQT